MRVDYQFIIDPNNKTTLNQKKIFDIDFRIFINLTSAIFNKMNRSINNLYSQSKILSNLPHNKHDCWWSKDESKQKTDLGVNTHQVKMS